MKNLNIEHGFVRKNKNEEYSTDASFLGAKVDEKIRTEINEFSVKNSIALSSRRKTVSIIRDHFLKPHLELKKQISYPELSSFNEKNENTIPSHKKTSNFIFFRKFSALTSLLRRSAELKRARMYSKTTRMLIIISITFILLNSPMAISKIHSVLLSSFESQSNQTLKTNRSNYSLNVSTRYTNKELNHHLVQRVSGYVYYLNFSVNFFLYVLNGSQFREILLKFTGKKK